MNPPPSNTKTLQNNQKPTRLVEKGDLPKNAKFQTAHKIICQKNILLPYSTNAMHYRLVSDITSSDRGRPKLIR